MTTKGTGFLYVDRPRPVNNMFMDEANWFANSVPRRTATPNFIFCLSRKPCVNLGELRLD